MYFTRFIFKDSVLEITKTKLLHCNKRVIYCNEQKYSKSVSLNGKRQEPNNINRDDIERHAKCPDWWNERGPMMGLHTMNKVRIPFIRNGLLNAYKIKHEDFKTNPQCLKGIKIMEVGCGAGILSEPFARLGADITGIDPGLEQINVAKNHASENAHTFGSSPPNYVHSTIEEHSARNPGVYDAVIASEVIEHVPDKSLFLKECLKALKPGGSFFLTTPNRTMISWLVVIIIAENFISLIPKGTHDWNDFITPQEVQQLLTKLGCTTVEIDGFVFNVFSRSWFSSKSTQMVYAVHAVKNQ